MGKAVDICNLVTHMIEQPDFKPEELLPLLKDNPIYKKKMKYTNGGLFDLSYQSPLADLLFYAIPTHPKIVLYLIKNNLVNKNVRCVTYHYENILDRIVDFSDRSRIDTTLYDTLVTLGVEENKKSGTFWTRVGTERTPADVRREFIPFSTVAVDWTYGINRMINDMNGILTKTWKLTPAEQVRLQLLKEQFNKYVETRPEFVSYVDFINPTDKAVEPYRDSMTTLYFRAVMENKSTVAAFLIDNGYVEKDAVNQRTGQNVLHLAAEREFKDLYHLLKGKGVNPDYADKENETGYDLYRKKWFSQKLTPIESLVKKKPDITPTELIEEVKKKIYVPKQQYVNSQWIPANVPTYYASTHENEYNDLLVQAICQGSKVLMEYLLSNKLADKNARVLHYGNLLYRWDSGYETMAHIAVMANNSSALEILEKYGSNMNRKNRYGITPEDMADPKSEKAKQLYNSDRYRIGFPLNVTPHFPVVGPAKWYFQRKEDEKAEAWKNRISKFNDMLDNVVGLICSPFKTVETKPESKALTFDEILEQRPNMAINEFTQLARTYVCEFSPSFQYTDDYALMQKAYEYATNKNDRHILKYMNKYHLNAPRIKTPKKAGRIVMSRQQPTKILSAKNIISHRPQQHINQ